MFNFNFQIDKSKLEDKSKMPGTNQKSDDINFQHSGQEDKLRTKFIEKNVDNLLKKINFDNLSKLIFKSESLDKNFKDQNVKKFFNPQFMVFSDVHQALYILLPLVLKENKNIVLKYKLACFFFKDHNNVIEFKKFNLFFKNKFENISNRGINSNSGSRNFINANFNKKEEEDEFKCTGIFLHQQNQNQICFFSNKKLAFIKNLNELNSLNENEHKSIELEILHDCRNFSFTYRKFKFWDFDNYYALLDSDNFLSIYSIGNELNEISINLNSDIVDFEFGKATKSGFFDAFSLFFLKETGEIYYTSPIFPKIFNINILMNFNDGIKFFEQKLNNRKPINEVKKKINDEHKMFQNDVSNHTNIYIDEDLDSNSISERIFYNLKKQELNKSHVKDNKAYIEINEYLQSFNYNISIDEINLNEKHNKNKKSLLLGKSYISFDEKIILKNKDFIFHNNDNSNDDNIKKTSSILSNENINSPTKEKYTQLHLIRSFPITIIRVYETNVLEIIILLDDLKPINNLNKIAVKEVNLLNAVLAEYKIFNQYYDIENAKLQIFQNKKFPHQLLINNISDLYLLNLHFSEKFYQKFLDNQKIYEKFEKAENDYVNYISSDIISLVKIDYLKIKNMNNNLSFSYMGIDFINPDNTEHSILLTINTDSKNNFVSHSYVINPVNQDKKNSGLVVGRKMSKNTSSVSFRRIRNSFTDIKNKKNLNDYFSKLENFFKT